VLFWSVARLSCCGRCLYSRHRHEEICGYVTSPPLSRGRHGAGGTLSPRERLDISTLLGGLTPPTPAGGWVTSPQRWKSKTLGSHDDGGSCGRHLRRP